MDRMDAFLEVLDEFMRGNGMTRSELARTIGVNHNAVMYWFERRFYPRMVNLISIADRFGCSVDYLLGLTDDKVVEKCDISVPFIERYDKLKELNGLNDNAIAKKCNIGNSAISKWRRSGRYPETQTILKLIEIFGCSVEYLIGRSDD